MLTKKQVMDILNNPFSYTKDERKEAVKKAIDILDNMAIAMEAQYNQTLKLIRKNREL